MEKSFHFLKLSRNKIAVFLTRDQARLARSELKFSIKKQGLQLKKVRKLVVKNNCVDNFSLLKLQRYDG